MTNHTARLKLPMKWLKRYYDPIMGTSAEVGGVHTERLVLVYVGCTSSISISPAGATARHSSPSIRFDQGHTQAQISCDHDKSQVAAALLSNVALQKVELHIAPACPGSDFPGMFYVASCVASVHMFSLLRALFWSA